MRLPRAALRSRVTIYDFRGNGSMGPSFASPRTVRASVQPINKLLITDVGEEQTADVMVMIRPEDGPVPVESKVLWNDTAYRVSQSFPMPDDFRPTHHELMLRRWSAPS